MGWADCGTDSRGRPIGYYHAATCDEPGCKAKIDRGLSYACGDMHGPEDREGGIGCEEYFCAEHLVSCWDCIGRCRRCAEQFEREHPEPDDDTARQLARDEISYQAALQRSKA